MRKYLPATSCHQSAATFFRSDFCRAARRAGAMGGRCHSNAACGKAPQRRRNADGGKSRMPRRRKRPAVIHRRRNRHARRHLVVEQTPDARTHQRRKFFVERIVAAGRVGINTAGQIAFELFENRRGLRGIARDDEQAKRCQTPPSAIFPARPEIVLRSRAAACSQICFPPKRRTAGDEFRARGLQSFHAAPQDFSQRRKTAKFPASSFPILPSRPR